ncbi:alpha/beta fold hydrolase [Hirschia baltica]|uniref:Alpha/beta hydrolase fold protein n=1 Tax=Hirschia baltica (strain ATCC 49814 / DSM 5838 / IFAM 1418) TaxID=582402 RepID=C6XLY3_HIRBI|nr:alpha/beta fold hydrolase [Hirschia baltica]ACT59815.1 alpha/beta hydrolase fold protein [Hirschia baltica ATCC 49814]
MPNQESHENQIGRFFPERDLFVASDGAGLGLSVWESKLGEPEIVFLGVHGMNDYAGAFRWSAPYWAEQGITTYAYDQRGFGRSPNSGIWPEEEVMRGDLFTATKEVRRRHPDAKIAVLGVSMGGALSMTAFASDHKPDADMLILSGPGLRGWGTNPFIYRISLWISSHIRPSWIVKPPKIVTKSITPTDNNEVLRVHWEDPYFQKTNRIDSVYGVVSLMEAAHKVANELPSEIPTLLLYGAKDQIIPDNGVKRTTPKLPKHVRTAYYEHGYHMLLRDIDRKIVLDDILAFANDPKTQLPSQSPELPWR